MGTLARCNGTLLVETPRGVGLVEQGGGWLGTAIFVTILLAVICTPGGIAILASGAVGGVVPLGIGAGCATLAVVFVKKKGALRTAEPGPPWLEIDLQAGSVLRPGRPPIPLAQCRLDRTFQLGSSSKALTLTGPENIVLARGTPFGDPVDGIEQALRGRGVR